MQKPNLSPITRLQAAAASVIPSLYDTPDPARVLLLSVSHWTGVVDWDVAQAHGVVGGIVKFMDGKSNVKFAEENYKGLVDRKMFVGGYSWLHRAAILSPGTAAREYLAFLKDHPCTIRPAVDFEWTADGNPYFDDLYGFAVPFSDGYGKFPMVYTAPGYWNDPALIAPKSKLAPMDTFWSNLPLWSAEYRRSSYLKFGPWQDAYKFLQWTANMNGAYYGYPPTGEKEAEGNYWTGSLADLAAWCSVPVVIPPVVTPPTLESLDGRLTAVEGRLTKAGL